MSDERRRLERELADAQESAGAGRPARKSGDDDGAKTIAGVKAMLRVVEGVGAKDLKGLADDAKAKIGSGVVAFVAVADGKASLVVGVTDDLTARISAVDLVRLGAEALGGKGGGGRPDMAQAGGPDGAKARDALAAIEQPPRRACSRRMSTQSRDRGPSHDAAAPRLCRCSKAGARAAASGHVIEAVLITLIVANVLAYTRAEHSRRRREIRPALIWLRMRVGRDLHGRISRAAVDGAGRSDRRSAGAGAAARLRAPADDGDRLHQLSRRPMSRCSSRSSICASCG